MNLEEKKKNILEILYILGENDIWDLAKPLSFVIYYGKEIDNELLDVISKIINRAIKETKDNIKIDELEKAKLLINDIKKNEANEKLEEENDINKAFEEINY